MLNEEDGFTRGTPSLLGSHKPERCQLPHELLNLVMQSVCPGCVHQKRLQFQNETLVPSRPSALRMKSARTPVILQDHGW